MQLQQKHEEMVFPALRSEPRPDIWVQDPVQQPSGADGHIETSQPDHTEGGETKRYLYSTFSNIARLDNKIGHIRIRAGEIPRFFENSLLKPWSTCFGLMQRKLI